jgi:hypothetical protein
MIEPISTAAALAIAKIAFEKFIEGGAVELGKNLTLATSEKVRKLGTLVWNKIQGNAKAVEVLEKAAEDKPEEMQKLKNYLHGLWKDENSEFAREVKKLADEIHFELTQIEDNSSMTQINQGNARGWQVKVTGGTGTQIGEIHNHEKSTDN